MIEIEQLDIRAFVRHYMLANTPRYLYRHLRAEPSVASLADSSTPGELLAFVSAYEQKSERTAEDVAISYAMLVALSFQDRLAVLEALANWHPRTLTWASHILSIISQTMISTTAVDLKAPQGRMVAFKSVLYETPTTVMGLP